jgi:hypothetical protein
MIHIKSWEVTHVGDGDSFSGITQILKHVLDEKGALGDVAG